MKHVFKITVHLKCPACGYKELMDFAELPKKEAPSCPKCLCDMMADLAVKGPK